MKKLILITIICLLAGNLFSQNSELADAAQKIIDHSIIYDPSYVRIKYPMGDVPADRGVCTDVIIRAYRQLGIDLQQLVHEDMVANFDKYPQSWGLSKPDSNIDHRRVPNLMTFFKRHGEVLPITKNPKDYKPGDIVCWNLGAGILHIGIVAQIVPTEYYINGRWVCWEEDNNKNKGINN
jgi:uncharacterized protein YijF (DUF1287 family)